MKILFVVGARPNFMKIAPIMREMAKEPDLFRQTLVHTGQHYDPNMSQVFFDQLGLPRPDSNLEVGSGSHAWQTAQVMQRFEPVLEDYAPDWVVVPGDVNSTLACALVAVKAGVRVAHVEAGLRSFDRTMPEEINRVLVDHAADLLFTTEPSANANLLREGIPQERVHFVGNTMIDTLITLLPGAESLWPRLKSRFALDRYVLVTLHRPSNVDDPARLSEILTALRHISREVPVLFPIHPRTRARIHALGWQETGHGVRLVDPVGYLDFLALQLHSSLVITDSGGIQEETTFLNVPCLTVRPNTERPITLTLGTNRLIDGSCESIVSACQAALQPAGDRAPQRPQLWDGRAAERIASVFRENVEDESRLAS